MILNQPNNPSGVVYSGSELEAIADICRRHNTIIIADEIYALTSFNPDSLTSMMKIYPEGTIVTGGLSKDRSCGGYRLGVGIFPRGETELISNALNIAGSTYSCVAAPIQQAALTTYADDENIVRYMRDCAAINAIIGRTASRLYSKIPAVRTTTPAGAFYLYVDFNDCLESFLNVDLRTCEVFCEHLLLVEHVALLPGSALLLPDSDFSVRSSYIDFDGDAALEAWRQLRPGTKA